MLFHRSLYWSLVVKQFLNNESYYDEIITDSTYYSKQCVPIASLVFTDLLMVSTRLRKLGNESKSESKGDKNMLQRLAGQVEIRPSKIISLFDRLTFDKRY